MEQIDPRDENKGAFDRVLGTTVAKIGNVRVKSGPLYMVFFLLGVVAGYNIP